MISCRHKNSVAESGALFHVTRPRYPGHNQHGDGNVVGGGILIFRDLTSKITIIKLIVFMLFLSNNFLASAENRLDFSAFDPPSPLRATLFLQQLL